MSNVHVRQDTQVDDFVKLRRERDKTLSPPALLFQSVQINIDAGAMPKPAADAKRFLKIPIILILKKTSRLSYHPVNLPIMSEVPLMVLKSPSEVPLTFLKSPSQSTKVPPNQV